MNNDRVLIAEEFGTDLSSRQRASELRVQIVNRLRGDISPFVIDLRDIRMVSHSFADELFAVIVAELGIDWFRENIHIENLSPNVRQTILEAIQERLTVGAP